MPTTYPSIGNCCVQRILLDVSVRLYFLIIQGTLELDRKDISIDANYIFVFGGSFTIGTEAQPFLQHAVITLYGGPTAQELPTYGAKTLACRLCTVSALA